ncbi:MAG: efflux transporter outer membrane subunit [Janthinobacterium lividum]
MKRLHGSLVLCAALLTACTVGPDYKRPAVDTPAQWRTAPYWQTGAPSHAPLSLSWWQVFDDTMLNDLEQRLLANNQSLQSASAHYEEARASLAQASSALFPRLAVNSGLEREKISGQRPVQRYSTPSQSTVQNDITLEAGVSYEVDLFGRVRRTLEGAHAAVEQASDDLANARLVLTANLATTYFSLRELDDEIDVVQRSLALQQRGLDYVVTEHDLGSVSGLDVMQQRSQLDANRTQAQLLLRQRAQYEHAIAAFIGVPAPAFSLVARVAPLPVPRIDLALPSALLQRRPDVASAERAMAQANARIGIARTAYFPDLTLSPTIGWESTRFASMLSAPSLLWSIGSSLGEVVFDGGLRRAAVAFAQQDYVAVQADYRQTVLTAFQEVQDGVTGLAVLDGAATQAHIASADAERLLSLANDRYSGGLVAYLDVISAQEQLLTSQRQEIQIKGQQAGLVVYLVKALGGGWSAAPVTTDLHSGKSG